MGNFFCCASGLYLLADKLFVQFQVLCSEHSQHLHNHLRSRFCSRKKELAKPAVAQTTELTTSLSEQQPEKALASTVSSSRLVVVNRKVQDMLLGSPPPTAAVMMNNYSYLSPMPTQIQQQQVMSASICPFRLTSQWNASSPMMMVSSPLSCRQQRQKRHWVAIKSRFNEHEHGGKQTKLNNSLDQNRDGSPSSTKRGGGDINGLPDLINQKGNDKDTGANTDKARKYLENLDGVKFNEIQVPDNLRKQLEYFDREELLQLIAYQKKYLDYKESRIKDLENYIDNLVVKIIETEPLILMNASNVLNKSRNLI